MPETSFPSRSNRLILNIHKPVQTGFCFAQTLYNQAMKIDTYLKRFSNPAQRALINEGIETLEQLSTYTEKDLLRLHGFGKASLPIIHAILEENGLKLKQQ